MIRFCWGYHPSLFEIEIIESACSHMNPCMISGLAAVNFLFLWVDVGGKTLTNFLSFVAVGAQQLCRYSCACICNVACSPLMTFKHLGIIVWGASARVRLSNTGKP